MRSSGVTRVDLHRLECPDVLIGAPHPKKTDARVLLDGLVAAGQRLVTDAEVLQEILHRYTAIGRREAIGPAFQLLLDTVDEVFAIEKADVPRAGEIAQTPAAFSARDAVHIALMERDRWPGLSRIHRI